MLDKFVVGSRWFRRDYEFEVVSNNGQVAEYVKVEPDGALNKYVGGIINAAGAVMQKTIHDNVLMDRRLDIRKSMGMTKKGKKKDLDMSSIQAHYYTLGFFIKHAFFGMRVIDKTKTEEGEWYVGITGKLPWNEEYGYELDVCPETWATKIYISFNKDLLSENLVFPTAPNIEENRACIYDTVWCRELITKGFRLGRAHRADEIRETVPKEYLKYFEQGLNS